MNLRVLSDLHLGPTTDERNQRFLKFLENSWKEKDDVLIVGDLFDLWLGWENLTMEFQRPILDQMKHFASSGLKIDYVEGNRDFGITELEGIIFRRVAAGALEFDWYGKKIHAEHGDLINESDRQYRLWRKISKNRFSYFVLRHLPPFATLRMAIRLEQGMKQTNRKHKSYYPEQGAQKFSRAIFEKGFDIIVVGHFHIEKTIEMHLKNQNVLFYNLPGWEHGLRYLIIPPGNATPYFMDWGKENGNSATA
jgi:UDP-2,3-diacylglucosamine hydrolase